MGAHPARVGRGKRRSISTEGRNKRWPEATKRSTRTSRNARRNTSPRVRGPWRSRQGGQATSLATVNKESGGARNRAGGRGNPKTHVSSKKGGKIGGAASAARSAEERSASPRRRHARARAPSQSEGLRCERPLARFEEGKRPGSPPGRRRAGAFALSGPCYFPSFGECPWGRSGRPHPCPRCPSRSGLP